MPGLLIRAATLRTIPAHEIPNPRIDQLLRSLAIPLGIRPRAQAVEAVGMQQFRGARHPVWLAAEFFEQGGVRIGAAILRHGDNSLMNKPPAVGIDQPPAIIDHFWIKKSGRGRFAVQPAAILVQRRVQLICHRRRQRGERTATIGQVSFSFAISCWVRSSERMRCR